MTGYNYRPNHLTSGELVRLNKIFHELAVSYYEGRGWRKLFLMDERDQFFCDLFIDERDRAFEKVSYLAKVERMRRGAI